MNLSHFIDRLQVYLSILQRNLSRERFVLVLSIVLGVGAGLAGVLLKKAVHFIFLLTEENNLLRHTQSKLWLPALGILFTFWIVRYLLRGSIERGLAQLHYKIAQEASIIPRNQTYAQLATSPVTVGMGGSAGLEAPIVITGAALGSNLAQLFRLNYPERTLLLACGVAAGIASAFNAPIAGVLFTIEVLLLEINTKGFIPLLIAAATGALVSKILLKEGALLSFELLQPFNYTNVPYYIVMGVLAGLMSNYHAKAFQKIEHLFLASFSSPYLRILIAGLLLALLVGLFPALFGEGYASIKSLANLRPDQLYTDSIVSQYITSEWLVVLFVMLTASFKAVATGITLGGGGNGGNFAPSLFVGAYLGFAYSSCINLLGIAKVPVNNFTIVGMAGMLSGLYHAPLTAVFLIAEITGGYSLMIPLILVAAISYFVSRSIEPHSMDTKKLAAKRQILSTNRDANILITMQLSSLIETDFEILRPDYHREHIIKAILASERNIFPVVENSGQFIGVIHLTGLKKVALDTTNHGTDTVGDLVQASPDEILPDEDITSVMQKFEHTRAWNLPVVTAERHYIGFVSRSKLFTAYREELRNKLIE